MDLTKGPVLIERRERTQISITAEINSSNLDIVIKNASPTQLAAAAFLLQETASMNFQAQQIAQLVNDEKVQ